MRLHSNTLNRPSETRNRGKECVQNILKEIQGEVVENEGVERGRSNISTKSLYLMHSVLHLAFVDT